MSSIVLFGSSNHVKCVSAGIVGYHRLCAEGESGSLEATSTVMFGVEAPEQLSFQISNKYFEVDLELHLYSSRELESFPSKLSAAECCIIVPSHDEYLDEDSIAVGKAASEHDMGVLLLVALRDAANEALLDQFREKRVLWALDNGFEYIEINSVRPTQDYNVREKDGLPRLMEALHSNMWSGMQRRDTTAKPSGGTDTVFSRLATPATAPSSDEAFPAHTQSSVDVTPLHESEDSNQSHVDHASPPVTTVTAAATVDTATTADGAGKEDMGGMSKEMEKDDFLSILNDKSYGGGDDDEKDDDDMWNTFTDVISQARQTRESAVSGHMSDAERRRRAEDLAMKLCAMMHFDDDSSEDGDN